MSKFFVFVLVLVKLVESQENLDDIPSTCSEFLLLPSQPQKTFNSYIAKCCPPGEQYYNEDHICQTQLQNLFTPKTIEVKFYVDETNDIRCIEDLESNFTLPIDERTVTGFVYINGTSDDLFFIIQNGSLLHITLDNTTQVYDIFDDYCVEMMDDMVIAKVMVSQVRQSRVSIKLVAVCMLFSVPCLIITAVIHLYIPRLRNIHGETLAGHALCLAVGFLVIGLQEIKVISDGSGYVIQYFLLASFYWLLSLQIDTTIHVYYFVPKNIDHKKWNYITFGGYFVLSMVIPLIIVLLTVRANDGTLAPYYAMGMEPTRLSRLYFIPPICFTLLLNLVLFISIYIGFRKLNAINSLTYIVKQKLHIQNHNANGTNCLGESGIEFMNHSVMEEVKRTAKSAVWLYTIMSINWLVKIILFYSDGVNRDFVIFDLLNALQGLLIFVIFVCTPHYKKIIRTWYKDRGSFETQEDCAINHPSLNAKELEELVTKKETEMKLLA